MKTVFNLQNSSVMKNYMKYICAILLLLGASAYAWGSVVTFHYTTDKGSTNVSMTKSGVTITVGAGDLKASNGYYLAAASSTMNITSSTYNIKKVVVHCVNATYAEHLKHKSGTAGTVSYKDSEVDWVGSTKEVKFVTDVGGQVRFNAVRVVLDDGQCSLLIWNSSKGMYEIYNTISSSTLLPYDDIPDRGDYTFMYAWSPIEFQHTGFPDNASGIYSHLLWSGHGNTPGYNLELYAGYHYNTDYTTRPGSEYETWITLTIAATPSSCGSAATSDGATVVSIKQGDIPTLVATPNSGYAFDYWSYDRTSSSYEFDDAYAATTDFIIYDFKGYTTGTITAHFVETTCTNPTVAFANAGPYAKEVNASGFTNTAAATSGGTPTGQTITYSSNNSSVASVDQNSGAVTIGATAGTARITATAAGTAEYCEMTAYYIINVSAIAPTVIKDAMTVSSITSSSISVEGGKITNKGGHDITKYGFVVGTSASVEYGTATKKGEWSGDKDLNSAFSSKSISGLSANTTYYVRAFAYNGTAYGYSEAVSFKTLQKYTITYDKNDGSSTTSTVNADAGGSITVGSGISWTRTGYTLSNWRLNNASSGTVYATGATYSSISENATFYAQWAVNTYSVRFNRNGGSGGADMANQNFTYGVAQNLTTNTYTRTGYTFAGWATSANGTVAYTDGQSVSNLSTTDGAVVDLYAKWTADEITIELSANGGENDGEAKVLYDATGLKSITHATYDGYNLVGYYAEAGHTTKVLNNDGSFAGTSISGYITDGKWSRTTDVTLYAYWLAEIRTVTFDLQGKGDNFTRDVENGTPVTEPTPAPTHIDYNFGGWYDEAACRDGHEWNFSTNITANTTIYAKWTAKSYENLIFTCVDITLVTEDGDPILVTSRSGINVMATKNLKVSVTGALAGHRVTLSGTDLKFYKKVEGTGDNAGKYKYVELTGANSLVAPLNEQIVYVSYNPSSTGTDGAPATPSITIACDGESQEFTGKVKARNLPDEVAIVARVGDSWHALPANMATEQNPAPIMVSTATEGGVLKAYGPSTLSYKLWPVYTVVGSGDRFGTATSDGFPTALCGDRLRFAGNSNNGLWANNSESSNGIKNFAAITAINTVIENNPAYEWKVTTTEDANGQFVYTLQTDQTQNTNNLRLWGSKWGTYDASHGIAEVYILPLVPTEQADITIMEWGTNMLAVKYANAGNVSSGTFKAKIGGSQTTVTCESLGGDIYKLTGVGDLQANPAKSLILTMTESSTAKQAVFAIPLIVTASKTEAEISALVGADLTEGRKVAKGLDVIIRNGGTLTTGTASGKFADLYIYPGGKADISQNIGVANIYLRGGFSWLDNAKDYRLPQMKVTDEVEIDGLKSHGIYYDLYLDNSMYYMMALPKDVALNDITTEDGVTTDFVAWVKGYSGEGRTKTPKVSGWQYAWNITPGTHLYRGRGYEIAIKPIGERTIGILRFPLLKATEWSNEGACTPAVKAWGYDDDNVTANNKGWNYIGNPYFTAFQNTDENGKFGTNMEIRDLVEHLDPVTGNWTGTYDWATSKVKYVTVPEKMYEDYKDVKATNYVLEAFFPFFIQAKQNGNLSFDNGSRILKAPTLFNATVPSREVDIDFTLTDPNGSSDNAGLTVGNDYSAEFDMDDKEKTIVNENFLKVYTMVGEYRTAFNSLPEATAALPIPVGYIAPVDGKYIFALDEAEYAEVEHVYLTDYDKNITVDLLDAQDNAYEFEATKGTNNTRLALNIILKEEKEDPIGTGVNHLDVDSDVPIKFIYQDKMYILHRGIIYDATGKRVREINK